MRYRQIHLDFHTGENIPDIGRDFDPDEFADTLKRAHVDSVTCFARCHHGYLYYPSQAFAERIHPHLVRPNLLGEQIEACHKRDIRVPIYITVQWDEFTANEHPEWLVLDADGRVAGTPPFEAGFYRSLCVNSPYLDFLKEQTREVLETLPVDGIFFDIVQGKDDSSKWARAGMAAEGLDPSCREARVRYGLKTIHEFKRDMTAFVRGFNKDCTVFYNAGHVGPAHRRVIDAYTHLELESLPSGGWGYLHFPLTARYARNLDVDILGMTGKFHTTWGDFHSFKNRAALEFECFQMLALNARCSVGDQLHPHGRICPHTYELIGSVYESVEAREPWCVDAEAVTDIGVLTPEGFQASSHHNRLPDAAFGAVRMLQELHHQFDIIDSESDLDSYRVLVLPDDIPVGPELAAKLETYIEEGGSILASHRSGLNPEGNAFALDALGVGLAGEAPFSPDFIVPRGDFADGMPADEMVMYQRGLEVQAQEDAEVLAEINVPFFNRDWRHWCSHRHTPSSRKAAYPGAVRNGRTVYLAHPVFAQYQENAPRWCRQLVANALDILLPDPVLRVEGPSTLLATINRQPDRNRWVIHLLHYIPERRGQAFDIIEDVIPLRDVRVSVRASGPVKRIVRAPEGDILDASTQDGRTSATLPILHGHAMLCVEFWRTK